MPTPDKGYWLDGDRLPSVTTILKPVENQDRLIAWAYSQGHEHGRKGQPPNRFAKNEEAKGIGTVAHAMVEAHLRGCSIEQLANYDKLPKLDGDAFRQAQSSYNGYIAWERQSQLEVVSAEQPLMCRCHRYGGTPDAIAEMNFDYSLLDLKTANGVFVSNLAQIAAYIHLWNVNNPDRQITGGSHLLRIPKEGVDFHHHFYGDLEDGWQYFVRARELYDLTKKLEKRIK